MCVRYRHRHIHLGYLQRPRQGQPVKSCPSISGYLQLQQLYQDEQTRCLSAAGGANGKSKEVDEQQRSEEKPGAHAKSGAELKLSSVPIGNPNCISF